MSSYFLGCFLKKKKKIINQNFQFLEKNSRFPNFSKKKKNEIFKKGLGTRGIRLILLRFLSKKIQNFHFLEKIQFFKKKKIINQKFQFHEKIQDFQNFQKKKKKVEGNFKKRPWD